MSSICIQLCPDLSVQKRGKSLHISHTEKTLSFHNLSLDASKKLMTLSQTPQNEQTFLNAIWENHPNDFVNIQYFIEELKKRGWISYKVLLKGQPFATLLPLHERYQWQDLPLEPVAKLPACEKSIILMNSCQNPQAGSSGGGGDILEKVDEPPPGQEASKGRFCAAGSFATGSLDQPFQLSRFAYIRQTVLETPLAPSRLILEHPQAPSVLHALASPTTFGTLKKKCPMIPNSTLKGFIQLLAGAHFLTTAEEKDERALQHWEFHDLLFHARHRKGRHSQPVGGTYRFEKTIPPLPALKSSPTKRSIPLYKPNLETLQQKDPSFATVLEKRASIRTFGDRALHCDQLGEFLYRSARVKELIPNKKQELSKRPYPGGGAIYELEIYPLIHRCQGLSSGLYHYLPYHHALEPISTPNEHTEKLLLDAQNSSEASAAPHVLFLITSRFQRLSWKYESIAYSLILKNLGALYQTFYLTATAMNLAPCAIGCGDSDLFSEATGISYFQETTVGEFMLGTKTKGKTYDKQKT